MFTTYLVALYYCIPAYINVKIVNRFVYGKKCKLY